MKKWTAILSNGEKIEEQDMSSWRKLKGKCVQGELKIQSLEYEKQEVDPKAVSYFVIFDVITFIFSKNQRIRRGIGSFHTNGKDRIKWETIQGNPQNGNYTEVVQPKDTFWQELSVEVERNQNEIIKSASQKGRS